ncbi:MAG: hypothetical protein L3J39_00845 [Verrucomicrobiales bacterium]|nr:hypothetical protein [Verrucomicrobiales bacterium]
MKISSSAITITTVLILMLAKISVRSEDKLGLELSYHEPDHLEPVNPYPSKKLGEYYAQVKSLLKLGGFSIAKMEVRPSFSAEYGVRLDSLKRKNNPATAEIVSPEIETTEKFLLTYSVADKSIWGAMPWNNINLKEQQEVFVTTTSVEIPKPLAKQIYRVWKQMLLRTRYSVDDGGGEDGTSYEFGMRYSVYGETNAPYIDKHKNPMLFVDLGESLIDYCKASLTERPAVAKTIKIKADILQKYLDKK